MSPDRRSQTREIPLPGIEPLEPGLLTSIPRNLSDCIVEQKWNGMRGIVYIQRNGPVRIETKSGMVVTEKFPELERDFKLIGQRHAAILDGEIVFGEGRTNGDRNEVIYRRTPNPIMAAKKDHPFWYVAFDIPFLDGLDIGERLTLQRKARLRSLLASLPEGTHISATGYALSARDKLMLLEMLEKGGHEGAVFKLKDSKYKVTRSGNRIISPWKKYKFKQAA